MLLFDLSGIVIHSCINLHKESQEDITINVVRHVAMNTLLRFKKRYSKEYGKPIICVDSKPYWRESVFSLYKKNRDKAKDTSGIDWVSFSKNFEIVKQDIEAYTPYPFINPARTEADDSISVLTQYAHARQQPVMIISSDKDMIQLQTKYKRVKQYSPRMRRLLKPSDNDYDLLTHIIKGDVSDGIPNIFSSDDVLMSVGGERQRAVTQKMLAEARAVDDPLDWAELDDVSRRKFKRNRILIDTKEIPQRIKDRIVQKYEHELSLNKKNKMMAYVREHRLRNLLESVKDF